MTPEERFMFDLEGYLVVENVLGADEVAELNAISDRVFPRDYQEGNDSKGRSKVRRDTFVSQWDPACQNLLDHPKILPYLVEIVGPKFRIDHDYCIFMDANSGGGNLHGLPEWGKHRYYHYRDGEMRNGLTVVTFCLAPAERGDGGFVCIPGSHKSNFAASLPKDVRTLQRVPHYVVQPVLNAGDVIIFTEALCHGTMRWTGNQERRALLFKYNPGHQANKEQPYNPADYINPTEQQLRIMAGPSVGGRPNVVG